MCQLLAQRLRCLLPEFAKDFAFGCPVVKPCFGTCMTLTCMQQRQLPSLWSKGSGFLPSSSEHPLVLGEQMQDDTVSSNRARSSGLSGRIGTARLTEIEAASESNKAGLRDRVGGLLSTVSGSSVQSCVLANAGSPSLLGNSMLFDCLNPVRTVSSHLSQAPELSRSTPSRMRFTIARTDNVTAFCGLLVPRNELAVVDAMHNDTVVSTVFEIKNNVSELVAQIGLTMVSYRNLSKTTLARGWALLSGCEFEPRSYRMPLRSMICGKHGCVVLRTRHDCDAGTLNKLDVSGCKNARGAVWRVNTVGVNLSGAQRCKVKRRQTQGCAIQDADPTGRKTNIRLLTKKLVSTLQTTELWWPALKSRLHNRVLAEASSTFTLTLRSTGAHFLDKSVAQICKVDGNCWNVQLQPTGELGNMVNKTYLFLKECCKSGMGNKGYFRESVPGILCPVLAQRAPVFAPEDGNRVTRTTTHITHRP
ncbi:hypothetical protein KCV07_g387, partial [Aureobasidium melanogenum]